MLMTWVDEVSRHTMIETKQFRTEVDVTRLSSERRLDLFDQVLSLVSEHGYENVTMDQIAAATHSSKATLYRQWGGKASLVIDALGQRVPSAGTVPDTGSLRGDLRSFLSTLFIHPDPEASLTVAVLNACKTDEELRDAVRERLISGQRAVLDRIVGRAVDRGELKVDTPAIGFLPVLIAGAVAMRDLIDGSAADADYFHHLVDAVLLPALKSETNS